MEGSIYLSAGGSIELSAIVGNPLFGFFATGCPKWQQKGGLKGRLPCHCFIRFRNAGVPTDYHGTVVADPASWCPVCLGKKLVLKCGPTLPAGVKLGGVKCRPALPLKPGLDCAATKACLDNQMDVCNAQTRCYAFCNFPNSNTAAYEFTSSCAGTVPPTPNLPTVRCPAGAPGWGPATNEPPYDPFRC